MINRRVIAVWERPLKSKPMLHSLERISTFAVELIEDLISGTERGVKAATAREHVWFAKSSPEPQ